MAERPLFGGGVSPSQLPCSVGSRASTRVCFVSGGLACAFFAGAWLHPSSHALGIESVYAGVLRLRSWQPTSLAGRFACKGLACERPLLRCSLRRQTRDNFSAERAKCEHRRQEEYGAYGWFALPAALTLGPMVASSGSRLQEENGAYGWFALVAAEAAMQLQRPRRLVF